MIVPLQTCDRGLPAPVRHVDENGVPKPYRLAAGGHGSREEKLGMTTTQLANLVQMESPQAVLAEVLTTVSCFAGDADLPALRHAFDQTVALYRGGWEETKGCNTEYHNLKHVTDCFLAMARLLHGAVETGFIISTRQVHQGLVSALLHDVGYLQNREDSTGTGAKFTVNHVRRSMDFMQRHFREFGIDESEVHACLTMIHATDLACDLATIPFQDDATGQIGRILAAADVLAQMADRTYLEKLLFLFYELDEAKIDEYCDELDLLKCSKAFYDRMADRFTTQLACADQLMIHHFKARWNIDQDLYRQAIANQRDYLMKILEKAAGDPRDRLRRGNIVATIRSRYN